MKKTLALPTAQARSDVMKWLPSRETRLTTDC